MFSLILTLHYSILSGVSLPKLPVSILYTSIYYGAHYDMFHDEAICFRHYLVNDIHVPHFFHFYNCIALYVTVMTVFLMATATTDQVKAMTIHVNDCATALTLLHV